MALRKDQIFRNQSFAKFSPFSTTIDRGAYLKSLGGASSSFTGSSFFLDEKKLFFFDGGMTKARIC